MAAPVRLGLRANAAQFSLLVALNALVGALVGLERSVLPLLGKHDFQLASNAAIMSFVVAFGAHYMIPGDRLTVLKVLGLTPPSAS